VNPPPCCAGSPDQVGQYLDTERSEGLDYSSILFWALQLPSMLKMLSRSACAGAWARCSGPSLVLWLKFLGVSVRSPASCSRSQTLQIIHLGRFVGGGGGIHSRSGPKHSEYSFPNAACLQAEACAARGGEGCQGPGVLCQHSP